MNGSSVGYFAGRLKLTKAIIKFSHQKNMPTGGVDGKWISKGIKSRLRLLTSAFRKLKMAVIEALDILSD
jgi:hypothetical protein